MQVMTQQNDAYRILEDQLRYFNDDFLLPHLTTADVKTVNLWYGSGFSYTFKLKGKKITLRALPAPAETFQKDVTTFTFCQDAARLTTTFQTELLQSLFSLTLGAKFNDYAIEDTPLLIEFVLNSIFQDYEKRFSKSVELKLNGQEKNPDRKNALCLSVEIEQNPNTYFIWIDQADAQQEKLQSIIRAYNADVSDQTLFDSKKILTAHFLLHVLEMKISQASMLERGDVIVLENFRPERSQLTIGSHVVWQAQRSNNDLKIISPPASHPKIITKLYHEKASLMSTDDDNNSILGDIPITVAFEIGRKDISIEELKTFKEGTVVPFPDADQTTIQILANGKQVGQGSLIKIENALGVKIDRIFSND